MTLPGRGRGRPVATRVHVARTDGAAPPDHLLSETERARAGAYLRAEDRRLSMTAAALVRLVAGAALGVAPDAVAVTRRCPRCEGAHGAPFVAGAPLLSVSHCQGFAVVATCDLPVGVDVEPRGRRGLAGAADVFLGPDEPRPGDDLGLLRTWVRKEATVKATGVGLRAPLADVQVTPPGDPPAVLRYGPRPGLAVALADLPSSDVVGAVAVLTDRPLRVRVLDATAALSAL